MRREKRRGTRMSRGRRGGGETEAERDKTKGDERYGGAVRADVGNPGVR